jgi:hypothetical protein
MKPASKKLQDVRRVILLSGERKKLNEETAFNDDS